jgi:Protein of unknown function, DUF
MKPTMAIVEGYVIEGHVPAELIQRLLKEKPAFAGLGVPGMPVVSGAPCGLWEEAFAHIAEGLRPSEIFHLFQFERAKMRSTPSNPHPRLSDTEWPR